MFLNSIAYSVERIAYRKKLSAIRYPLNAKTLIKGFSVTILMTALFISPAFAQQISSKEPIVVNGDKVEYFHDKKEVIGTGNISITYKDAVLTCEKIVVHLDTHEAIAEGNVKVADKGAYFTGDVINYNFDTKKGRVVNGYLDAKPFYGRADEVDKAANKEQYTLDGGYVTTCDLEKPHYRVQSRQVKIYLNDKVTATHILFLVGDVPIMYIPYYIQPLKETPKANITVMPGERSDWGYYALTSFRYYFSADSRGDLLLDYRSKKGLAEGINYYYNTRGVGTGSFKFYYTHENDAFAYEKTGEARNRYRYQLRHKWDIEDQNSIVTVELNKLSDKDVIRDYIYNEYEELGANPDNYISIATAKKDYSTLFLVRKRFDNFFTVVERLPEYDIDIPNYRIDNTSLYYKAHASASYLNLAYDKSIQPVPDGGSNAARIDVYNQLSYAARLFKTLSVTPFGGIRETYYSKNKWGDTNAIRTLFTAGVDSSIKFYKVYDVETNFLGLDINKLRHIITPTANYYFAHQPTISPANLIQFDEVDAFNADNGIKLGLENRLQTKRLDGEQMKSVDLATLLISTDYKFRFKDDDLETKSRKLANIDFKLELVPYSWAYIVINMSVNPKNPNVETESIDLVATKGDKWSAAISQRYENVQTGQSNFMAMDATYKINGKWKIRAYERFNAVNGSFEEQEYTVYRDLHCWTAEFTYNVKGSGDQTFWAILRLKAFPEYPIGVQRTYSRPRFGSTDAR